MPLLSVSAQLKLNIQDFAKKLTEASKKTTEFASGLSRGYDSATASLKSHNLGLKDTARIVQGIMISQVFYSISRTIREATGSLIEFNEQLDYMRVTYSALMGSTQLADDFIKTLQEHSVNTIFGFSELSEASQTLLSYGIEYKNLMFILKGLTNLGSVSGDKEATKRIARALGQIYTKGTLKAEEMHQLANAQVPIYDIIQSSFNLTGEQMGKVGKLGIAATDAINAVVDYANEKFGSVGDAAMYTITGLKNRIVDTFKVLASDMTMPLTIAFKSFLAYVANGLDKIRDTYSTSGVGGVFEMLVPDKHTQVLIRQTLANIQNMLMTIVSVLKVIGQVAGQAMQTIAKVFNIAGPPIMGLINALAAVVSAMLNTGVGAWTLRAAILAATAAFVVLRVNASIAGVMTVAAAAINKVSAALLVLSTIITKHPIIAIFGTLAAILAAVAVSSRAASGGISGLIGGLAGPTVKTTNDMLKKTEKEVQGSTDAASQFEERLEGATAAAEDLKDEITDAGKAAKKSLLSFDEVFSLTQNNNTIDKVQDYIGSIGGYEIPNFSISGQDILDGIEIPDFSGYIDDFTDSLFGGLESSLMGKLALAGIGALFAGKLFEAIKTGVESNPDGAKNVSMAIAKAIGGASIGFGISALLSPLTDKIWTALEDAFKFPEGSSVQASLGSTIGATIGGAIGMVVAGLPGTIVGSLIGQLAGGIVGLFWQKIGGALSNTLIGGLAGIGQAIAGSFGSTLTEVAKNFINTGSFAGFFSSIGSIFSAAGLKAVLKGGVIGMAIGFVTDAIAAMLWDTLIDAFGLEKSAKSTAKVGQTIGSVIGAVIGGIFGGPVGAMIGSAIGTFAGGFVGLFWDKIVQYFKDTTDTFVNNMEQMWSNIFKLFQFDEDANVLDIGKQIVLGILAGIMGAVATILTALWTYLVQPIIDGIKSLFGIASPAKTMIPIGQYIVEGIWEGIKSMLTWIIDNIALWVAELIAKVWEWGSQIITSISEWATGLYTSITTWLSTVLLDITTWFANIKLEFTTWYDETLLGFTTWAATTYETFVTWAANTWLSISTWVTNTYSSLSGWVTNTMNRFTTWSTNVYNSIATWVLNTTAEFLNWYNETLTNISSWCEETYADFIAWKDEVIESIVSWSSETLGSFLSWVGDTIATFNDWRTQTMDDFAVWFSSFASNLITWWSNAWNTSNWRSGWSYCSGWFNSLYSSINSWFSSLYSMVLRWWNSVQSILSAARSYAGGAWSSVTSKFSLSGHATGGIFTKEHVARFAEGNKAEAVIPLENKSAMQPFVDLIASGVTSGLAPVLANIGSTGSTSDQLPPVYVGTLIADERGLRELERKMRVIRVQEERRGS